MFADVTTRTRRFKDGIYEQVACLGKDVGRFLLSLRRLAESRLAEIERATRAFFDASNTLEGVQGDDLLRRVKSGEVTVLDVRPVEEYKARHIPGALTGRRARRWRVENAAARTPARQRTRAAR